MELKMPKLGESVTEGTIGTWLVAEGDAVAEFEPLVEIVTDKVTAELPSTATGVLQKILAPEGEIVAVGEPIALIRVAGEAGEEPVKTVPPEPATASQVVQELETVENQEFQADRAGPEAPEQARRRFSPAVRRLASENNVDLALVDGTGIGGRITRRDVQAYVDDRHSADVVGTGAAEQTSKPEAVRAVETPVSASGIGPWEGDEIVQLSAVRRTIADRMVVSKSTVPHAWTMVEVDATGLVKFRERQKDTFREREGFELTYLPMILKVASDALREYPRVNSVWDGDRIIQRRQINIGVAVGLEDELVVPVIHGAGQLSVTGMARDLHQLVQRARTGNLSVEDVQRGTFTVNNTGAFGSILSYPIINAPQAAILTTERITPRPVVVNDAIAIRHMMNLCMSIDHRVLDGVVTGRFLQSVRRRIEEYDVNASL